MADKGPGGTTPAGADGPREVVVTQSLPEGASLSEPIGRQRERVRGRLAMLILALLAAEAAAIVVLALVAAVTRRIAVDDVKDIALIFFPTTASIFATVIGFYFGSVESDAAGSGDDSA